MKELRAVVFAAMCLGASSATAAERGFYFGLNAGQAKYDFAYEAPLYPLSLPSGPIPPPSFNPFPPSGLIGTSPGLIFRNIPIAPVSGVALNAIPARAFWIPRTDDEANAFGGFVGYRVFPYAAVELSYAHLGTLHEYQPEIRTTNFILPAVESEMETSGPALSVLAILPVSERWDLYLRGGMLFADQKVRHESGIANGSTTYGSNDWLFGAGAQFNIGEHWSVRLDLQRYDSVGKDDWIGEADVDVWSVGAVFRL